MIGQAMRRPRCAALLLLAVLVAAIAVAGCGGGSSMMPSARGPLSSAALAAKGDAICERLRAALNAADGEAGGTTLPGRAKLSILFAAAEERASAQLEQLKPQASAVGEWLKVIAARRGLAAYHHEMTKYASREEADKLEAAYKAYKVAQWQMQLGFKHSRFGFKICWDIG